MKKKTAKKSSGRRASIVGISLMPELLKEIDKVWRDQGFDTRSGFVKDCVRRRMAELKRIK